MHTEDILMVQLGQVGRQEGGDSMAMQTINLEMNPRGCDKRAGPRGEDRMTRLVIPLPAGTATKIKSCVVLLSLGGAHAKVSQLIQVGSSGDAYIKAKKVYFILRQEMTYCQALRVQLQCYPDPSPKNLEHFISRTELSEWILFSPALADGLENLPESRAGPGAISELTSMLPQLRALIQHPSEAVYSPEGVHGIRMHEGCLQGNDGSGWKDILGAGMPKKYFLDGSWTLDGSVALNN